MVNGILAGLGMIVLVAGLATVLSLPTFFTATHRLLFALVVLVSSSALIAGGIKD